MISISNGNTWGGPGLWISTLLLVPFLLYPISLHLLPPTHTSCNENLYNIGTAASETSSTYGHLSVMKSSLWCRYFLGLGLFMMLLLSQSQFGIDEVFVTKKNHDDNTRRQDSSQLYSPLLPPTALATTMTICPCCCLDLPLFSVFSTLFTDLIVLIHCPLIVLTMWVSLSVLLVAVVTYCGPHYPSSLSS